MLPCYSFSYCLFYILFFNLLQMFFEDEDFPDNLQHALSFWWKLIVSTSYIKSKFFSPFVFFYGLWLVIFIQFMNWYWSGFIMVSWILVWSKIFRVMWFFLFCIHLMDENFWNLVFEFVWSFCRGPIRALWFKEHSRASIFCECLIHYMLIIFLCFHLSVSL